MGSDGTVFAREIGTLFAWESSDTVSYAEALKSWAAVAALLAK